MIQIHARVHIDAAFGITFAIDPEKLSPGILNSPIERAMRWCRIAMDQLGYTERDYTLEIQIDEGELH